MRLFVWSVAFSLILLLVFIEAATLLIPQPHREDAYTLPVHKTLYIERNVYDDEMLHIVEAAIEWNEATNGQVIFDIKKMPRPNINPQNSIVFFNVTPDFPDIIILDNARKKPMNTLAYFSGSRMLPYIAVVDQRIAEKDYTAVMLHELGHYLGLQHPDDDDNPDAGVGTLMHSSIDEGSNHITAEDLKQFCQLYHCDSSKFHGVSQVQ